MATKSKLRKFGLTTFFLVFGIAFLALFQACAPGLQSTAPNEAKYEKMESEIEVRNEEINQLAKSVLSCKSDNDCIAIAAGFKGCGGPRTYVVTSAHNDTENLRSLIEELTNLEQDYAETVHQDQVSTCELIMPPHLKCKADICEKIPTHFDVAN